MSKIVKIILSVIAAIIGIFIIAVTSIFVISNSKINKTYNVNAEEIKIPTAKTSIERGKHLVWAVGKCPDCHSDDLGGGIVVNDAMFGRIVAPNITPGAEHMEESKHMEGEEEGEEETEEFVLAIRHGINHGTKKSLILMPAQSLTNFSDEDLGSIIAYLNSVKPIKRHLPNTNLGPIGRLLLIRGVADELLPASLINHNAKRPEAPKPGVTEEYGKYLVDTSGCRDCHQKNLAGGSTATAPPETPAATNLTPGGELKEWSLADFTRLLREGKTGSNRTLNAFMPWKYTRHLTNDEIKAMYKYLKSLPVIKGVEHEEEEHEE